MVRQNKELDSQAPDFFAWREERSVQDAVLYSNFKSLQQAQVFFTDGWVQDLEIVKVGQKTVVRSKDGGRRSEETRRDIEKHPVNGPNIPIILCVLMTLPPSWSHVLAISIQERLADKNQLGAKQNMRQERTASERTLDRALTIKTGLGAQVSESRHETETKLDMSAGIRTPRSQHETRHADKRAHGSRTLETVRSHKNRTITGVSELCRETKK
ncbi:hypothetical protein DPX16_21000 [Anabarilius grahami]|uniref:Uncharacterized protein n=1 Tax=Anabarilius grahami TaxID=495550 RepID=A0A3N0YW84_ANAGA|nr:hypothetical protein DPX16_21000 [Anabarilius grahami]